MGAGLCERVRLLLGWAPWIRGARALSVRRDLGREITPHSPGGPRRAREVRAATRAAECSRLLGGLNRRCLGQGRQGVCHVCSFVRHVGLFWASSTVSVSRDGATGARDWTTNKSQHTSVESALCCISPNRFFAAGVLCSYSYVLGRRGTTFPSLAGSQPSFFALPPMRCDNPGVLARPLFPALDQGAYRARYFNLPCFPIPPPNSSVQTIPLPCLATAENRLPITDSNHQLQPSTRSPSRLTPPRSRHGPNDTRPGPSSAHGAQDKRRAQEAAA